MIIFLFVVFSPFVLANDLDAFNESVHPVFFKVNSTVVFAGIYNLSDLTPVVSADDIEMIKLIRRMDATAEDKELAVGDVLRDAFRLINASEWAAHARMLHVPARIDHKKWKDTTRWNLTLSELVYKPWDERGQLARASVFFGDTTNNYQLFKNWAPICMGIFEDMIRYRAFMNATLTFIDPDATTINTTLT
jgi:hypothetical protein